MSHLRIFILAFALVSLSACSLYRSADRKEFESSRASFSAQNLKLSQCGDGSLRTLSSGSVLVTVLNTNNETSFLWEHKINNESIFESDNLRGVYCLYENN